MLIDMCHHFPSPYSALKSISSITKPCTQHSGADMLCRVFVKQQAKAHTIVHMTRSNGALVGAYCITKYTVSESLMSLFVSCNDIVADIAERIRFAEHGKLVSESSEFHLTLSRAHKGHFFQPEIRKKSGTF